MGIALGAKEVGNRQCGAVGTVEDWAFASA